MTGNYTSLHPSETREIELVMCPCCRYEWTALRSCSVWLDEGRPPMVTNLCVRCAEGVGAFPWLQEKWPWDEPAVITTKKGSGFFPIKTEDLSPAAFRTTIEHKEKSFFVTCRIGSKPIAVAYNGATERFDNSVAAWFHVREKLAEKPAAPVKADW